jgi:hypothetical protein
MAEKLTIFISGTMRDLPTKRARVAAAIQDMGLEPVWARTKSSLQEPENTVPQLVFGLVLAKCARIGPRGQKSLF